MFEYIYIYMYMYIRLYTYMIYTYIYMIYIYIHTCIYICIHRIFWHQRVLLIRSGSSGARLSWTSYVSGVQRDAWSGSLGLRGVWASQWSRSHTHNHVHTFMCV